MANIPMYWFCYLVFVMMVYGMERRVMSVLKVNDSSQFKLYDKKQIQAETGQNITLSGWFNSSAVPEYRFNGEPIKESKNIRITWYQNNRILTILKLEDTHTGFYELYHPSLKTSDQIYLYVKSENIFVPSISYKLFCYEPICIVPCRLTNYADESGVVQLFLDGRKQNRTYDPRVGYEIPQNQLENNVVNAACHKSYRKVHYTIELQDELPNDWILKITNINPWPNLNDTVSFKCSLSYNTSYAASVFASEIVLLHEREGDSDPKTICLIDSSDEARVNNHNNIITTEKEFKILKYTPDCRGKLICKVMNMTSNRSFNRHSSIYLDQLEITSRTNAIVETTVKHKEKIAAELRAPSEVRQHIDIKWSRLSETLFCRESACLISNETKVLQLITTDNTTISIFQDIEEDKPGWHRYSAQFNKKGSNKSIQEVFWDVYVRAPVELRTNCSSLLLKPTVCMFTLISSVPDKSKMFISRLGKTDEISSYETETTCGKFHCLMTYLVNITRTTSIEGRSSTDKPRIQKIFCVEFSFSVDPSFDSSNAQDIYEGDNVTVKGGIAEFNESFRINGSSLFSSLTREYTEIILTNVSSSFDRRFHLFNSTEHILATMEISAPKKIVAPHNSTTETIYYSESLTQLTCHTEGSPIVYNWTKNGISIRGHNRRNLSLDILDPLGDFECCGINRVGTECSIINLKLAYVLLSAKTASIAVSIVITIILLFVVSWVIYMYMNETKVILLAGAQGAGKTTILNMFLNCMKVTNVWDLDKSNIEFASRFDYKFFGINQHKDLMKRPNLLFGDPAEDLEDYQSATRDPRCIKPLRYNGQLYAMADIPGFAQEDRIVQNWTQLLSNLWHCKLRRVHCIGLVRRLEHGMWDFFDNGTKYLLTMLPKKSDAIKVILTNSNYEDLKDLGLNWTYLSRVFRYIQEDLKILIKRGYVEMDNNMLLFLVVRGIELPEDYRIVRAECVERKEWIKFFDIQKGEGEIANEIRASNQKGKLDGDKLEKRQKNAETLYNSISDSFNRSRDAFLELLGDVKSNEPIPIRTMWLAHMNNQADELILKLASALLQFRVEDSRLLAPKSLLSLLIDDIFELGKQKTTFLSPNLRNILENAEQHIRIANWAIINLHSSAFETLVKLFDILVKAMRESPTSESLEKNLLDCLERLSKIKYPEQLKKIFSFLSLSAESKPTSLWHDEVEKLFGCQRRTRFAYYMYLPKDIDTRCAQPSLMSLIELIRSLCNEYIKLHQIIDIFELGDVLAAIRRLLDPDLFADIVRTFRTSNTSSSLREAEEANGSEQNFTKRLSPNMTTLLNLIFTKAFLGDKARIARVLRALRGMRHYYRTSSRPSKNKVLARIENAIRFIEDVNLDPSEATIADSSEPHSFVTPKNTSSARYNASEETVQLMTPVEQVQPQTRISEINIENSSDQRGTFAEDDSDFNVDYCLPRTSEPSNGQRKASEDSTISFRLSDFCDEWSLSQHSSEPSSSLVVDWKNSCDDSTSTSSDNITEVNVRLNKQKQPPSANAAPSEQSYLLVSLILRFLRGIPEFFLTLYRWCWIEPRQEREIKQMQRKTKERLETFIEKLKEFRELSDIREQMQSLAHQVMEPKKP